MKNIIKILVVIAVIALGLYFSLWGFVNLKGKAFLEDKLSSLDANRVSIGKVSFLPPLGIKIEGLNSSRLTLKELKASLSLPNLLIGRLYFNALGIKDSTADIVLDGGIVTLPFYTFSRDIKGTKVSSSEEKPSVFSKSPKVRTPVILIKTLSFSGININFTDKTKDKGFRGSLSGIKGRISNFSFPLKRRMSFSLLSGLKIKETLINKDISLEGWIDFRHKSMNSSFKINKFSYRDFSMYYPDSFKPDNLGVEKAVLSLTGRLKSIKNNLSISGNLSLIDYKFAEDKNAQMKTSIIKGVLGMFKGNKGYPEMNFETTTKFDHPRLDFSMIKAQFKSKMSGLALVIGKEAVKGVVNLPKATANKTVDLSKDTAQKAVDVAGKAIGEVLKSPEHAKDIIKSTGDLLKSLVLPEPEGKGDQSGTK